MTDKDISALASGKTAAVAMTSKAIPDGWRLVPDKATDAMVNAVRAGKLEPASPFHVQRAIETIKNNYLKMLAAVPAEPDEWPDAKTSAAAVAVGEPMTDRKTMCDMPNPSESDLESPVFEAIWQTIKRWDVNVPNYYIGYCGANGSHVKLILDALVSAYSMDGAESRESMHENVLSDIAKQCARKSDERHDYLPVDAETEYHFHPHKWVMAAMRAAISWDRKMNRATPHAPIASAEGAVPAASLTERS